MSDHGFECVIGLEVHCQLDVRSKLFSCAPAAFGGEPNSRVSPVDLGLPGVLPVLNGAAVRAAVRAALALGATIHERSQFARKSYFYPDLPKGYQITQYDRPYCSGGTVPLGDGRTCALERIHLEEDAGKSTHTDAGSLVDLNRAGVALIEIVGRPDLRAPTDAHAYLDNLRQILQYATVSDCDMEKGSLRCDANISVRPHGQQQLGTKVEIKNLNSFKMVERALEYELRRQTAVLAGGGTVVQETRLWNEERGETATMRSKESATDYRYFPEPDLPPLEIDAALIEAERRALPELPDARRARLAAAHGLPAHDLTVLLADAAVADYFEAVATACGDAKAASNWTMTEVLRALRERELPVERFPVPPATLAALIRAVADGEVSRQAGKKVFARMLQTGEDTAAAIAALDLGQISDRQTLDPVVRQVLADNAAAVDDYRRGVGKAFHALKGKVMRATGGRANPSVVDDLLRAALGD